ncbi:MAG: putative membrane protein [Paracoccaceae bacterium]|jgi:uncharacterized membrane protein
MSDTKTPPETRLGDASPGRRWVRWLLIASLGVNLAVAGVVGGAILSGEHDRERPQRFVRDLGFGPYGQALTKDQIAALRPEIRSRRSELRQTQRKLRQGFSETVKLLRLEPFDPARLSALIAQQGLAAGALQQIGRELLIERIAAMSPQDRLAFADRLETGVERSKSRGGFKDGESRPRQD